MQPFSLEKLKELNYNQFKGELTKNMKRHERKSVERKLDKLNKAYNTMTPTQKELVELLAQQKTEEKMNTVESLIDDCFIAHIILEDENATWEYISTVRRKLRQLMSDYMLKQELILEENKGDIEMSKKAIEAMELKLEQRIIELIKDNKNQKQALDILLIEFPKLAKSMIVQAYKTVKEELKNENEKVDILTDDEKQIEEYAKYIVGEDDENMKSINNETVITVETEDEIKVPNTTLKVKSKTMEIEGKNGEYTVSNDGVILVKDDIKIEFKNIEELELWANEIKEVFGMFNN